MEEILKGIYRVQPREASANRYVGLLAVRKSGSFLLPTKSSAAWIKDSRD